MSSNQVHHVQPTLATVTQLQQQTQRLATCTLECSKFNLFKDGITETVSTTVQTSTRPNYINTVSFHILLQ